MFNHDFGISVNAKIKKEERKKNDIFIQIIKLAVCVKRVENRPIAADDDSTGRIRSIRYNTKSGLLRAKYAYAFNSLGKRRSSTRSNVQEMMCYTLD